MDRRGRVAASVGLAAVALYGLIGVAIGYPCARIGVPKGVWIDRCPTGDLRLSAKVRANGLLRGGSGEVAVAAELGWLGGEGRTAVPTWAPFHRGYSTTVTLRDAAGSEVPGLVASRFRVRGDERVADVTLPAVPDGDYLLHVAIDAGFEATEVVVPLALYAPAVVHVATDRKLYKPGQDVLLRSTVLARTDLAPIEGRPGRWRIWSPSGDVLLVERDAVGAWGVADSSFPLANDAEVGTWRAAYETGQARDEVTFDVRPFRLPRFVVDLAPIATWYRPAQAITLRGTATYTSGAPVANAGVSVRVVQTDGAWPIPLEWGEPRELKTDARGGFAVDLGPVPGDLVGRAGIAVRATVTDETGEALAGMAAVPLSVDDLAVEAVSELEEGLVANVNNRLYLRVTRPDGVPLRDTAIQVRNPWLPDAPVKGARTDVDGVAALQIDPGEPVTVVEPALPVRAPPTAPAAVVLRGATELGRGGDIDLVVRRAVDAVSAGIERCVHRSPGPGEVTASVAVLRSGAVHRVLADAGHGASPQYRPLESCVEGVAEGLRFGPGDLRTYELRWALPESRDPRLDLDATGGDAVSEALATAAIEARSCLPRRPGENGTLAYLLHYSTRGRQLAVDVDARGALGAAADACVARAFMGLALPVAPPRDALGVARGFYRTPVAAGAAPAQATTRVGFELQVAAVEGDDEIGRTRLVLGPGAVPDLRIRATPSLAKPGEEVVFEFLRGPGFSGSLPDEVWLAEGSRELVKAKVDRTSRKVAFAMPADASGFLSVSWGSARAVVFVQRPDPLTVSLSTDKAIYRPGEQATLTVTTSGPAAVSLIGVDQSLGQLSPLLSPDDWGRVTVRVTADRPAFGAFEPRGLALGQIHGENAARAAVLRITQIPSDPAGDERVSASAAHDADTLTPIVEGFWRVHAATASRVRAWEASAPAGEVLEPTRVVAWWDEAVATEQAAGRPAVDGFGRPLAFAVLPWDLLAELDPRRLVSDATRLSEDDVGWNRIIREGVR